MGGHDGRRWNHPSLLDTGVAKDFACWLKRENVSSISWNGSRI